CPYSRRRSIPSITRGRSERPSIVAPVKEALKMPDYRFAVIVTAPVMSQAKILDATDRLGETGCTDAAIRGHAAGMELLFLRTARSLQAAISSAIADVEKAGFPVLRV